VQNLSRSFQADFFSHFVHFAEKKTNTKLKIKKQQRTSDKRYSKVIKLNETYQSASENRQYSSYKNTNREVIETRPMCLNNKGKW